MVRARKEVILAAGTIGSPHLLMLSGVGDRQEPLNPRHTRIQRGREGGREGRIFWPRCTVLH